MQFPLDSEYQDISFIPLPGQATETGRNKVELVLQTRDPEIDSDLAWSDVAVLASSLVAPAGVSAQPVGPIFELPARRAATSATVQDRLGRRLDLSNAINLGASGAISSSVVAGPVVAGPIITELIDPPIWEVSATLPGTGGKPARIAVREYERYYTDRTVPEFRAGATRRRRIVEERLVYTAFFAL